MKEQRFEKVVEWEKEPDWFFLIFFSFVFILSILLEVFCWDIYSKSNLILLQIIGSVSLIFILVNLGKGRKVYWRKIK
jgi:hypothetical protein